MREVFFAGKETQKRPSLQSYMITDCASEHWVVRFECVEHRLLRDRSGNVQSDFTANMGEVSKVCRQNDANHSLTIFSSLIQHLRGIPNGLQRNHPADADFARVSGRSLSTAQNFPMVFTASANWAKSTGLTT